LFTTFPTVGVAASATRKPRDSEVGVDSRERNLRAHARAGVRRAVDLERPAEGLDPVDEAANAGAGRDARAADAVVSDLDARDAVRRRRVDAHHRGPRMLRDVRQ